MSPQGRYILAFAAVHAAPRSGVGASLLQQGSYGIMSLFQELLCSMRIKLDGPPCAFSSGSQFGIYQIPED